MTGKLHLFSILPTLGRTIGTAAFHAVYQALQDELERSRLELEQAVKEKDSTIAAKDKEISQVSRRMCYIL